MARVLCAEIGYSKIRMCEMAYNAKKPKVYRVMEADLPEGTVADGFVNPEKQMELETVLRDIMKANRVKAKKIIFTVTSSKIINREITLPPVKVNMIESMVFANISEYFPVDLTEYEKATMLLETFADGDNKGRHRVLVIAAEKELIRQYQQLAAACGLKLVDIDYACNGIFQATKNAFPEQTTVVVKLEEQYAAVIVLKKGTVALQRTVNYGIGGVVLEEENFFIGANGEEKNAGGTVAGALSLLVDNIGRIIDLYNNNAKESPVEKILLVGAGSKIKGITGIISAELGLPCEKIEKLPSVNIASYITSGEVCGYAGCFGAGVAPLGLVPDEKKEKGKKRTNFTSTIVLLVIFFLVMCGTLVTIAFRNYLEVVEEGLRLQRLEEEYAQGKATYDYYTSVLNFYTQLELGHRMTEHSNDGLLNFLTELEKNLPADVEVEEFSSNDEQSVITMVVSDKEKAAGVIEMLRSFDSVMQVSVQTLTEHKEENAEGMGETEGLVVEPTTIRFTVNCIYYPLDKEEPQQVVQATGGEE